MTKSFGNSFMGCALALTLGLTLSARVALSDEPTTPPPDDAPADTLPTAAPAPATSLRTRAPASRAAASLQSAIPNIGGGIWLAKGPGPAIDGQTENVAGPNGMNEVVGAVHTLASPDPENGNILYAGGVNGGVWKTTNALAESPIWTPLTDDMPSLSIGALEFDPLDPTRNTLVAGIGRYSSFGSRGGVRTGKLLKTTDDGATWTELAGSVGPASDSNISGVAPRGATIVASSNQNDTNTCADIGIFRSTDGGASFGQVPSIDGVPAGAAFDLASDPINTGTLYTGITFADVCSGMPNGIYKSTDTGASWAKVSDAAMDALIVDGTTNNIEIAARGVSVFVNIIQDGQTAGIFHSGDSGSTWAAMDLPLTPEGPAIAIADASFAAPIVITSSIFLDGLSTGDFVTVSDVTGNTAANGVFQVTVLDATSFELRNSVGNAAYSGGGTYAEVAGLNPRNKPGGQGGIHAAIRIDPQASFVVHVGGDRQNFPNSIGADDFSGRLFRGRADVPPSGPPQSVPSPQWEHLTHSDSIPSIPGGGTANSSAPHADSREMVWDLQSDTLVEGDDGGIYRRTIPYNNTGDWISIIGNMQVTEQHDIAYDSVSNIIISGNQDTGTTQQQTPNGLVWDSVSTADGGDVAVDDTSVPGVSTRYSSFQNLGAFRRIEWDEDNVEISTTFITPTFLGAETVLDAQFVTPVELDPNTPTRLAIGACNAIFESLDQGDSVTEIGGSVGIGCPSALTYGGNFGGAPDPGTSWAAVGDMLYLRFGTGGSYSQRPAYPGGSITDIAVDPSSTATAYVANATAVYRTFNDGTTWEDITGNLTDTQIQSIAIDGPGARLFVGGREGVSVLPLPPTGASTSGPYVWGRIGTGLPNAPVWDMEWDHTDEILVVGTLGRGAWVLQENGVCAGGTIPDSLVVNNQWIANVQFDQACTLIMAGPSLDVMASGDLTLRAPTVILDDGFAVKTGGQLTVDNAVP